MVETFNIDIVKLFTEKTDALLTIHKPPVSRGSYRLQFNIKAMDTLGICHEIPGIEEGTSATIRNRIALAWDNDIDKLVGFTTCVGEFFSTKTIAIAKNGIVSNKRWHGILSEKYEINWEETDEFTLVIAPYPENKSLIFFQPFIEITDAQALTMAREELNEIDETISEASALNEARPMVAE